MIPAQTVFEVGTDKQFHTINAAIAAANAAGGNADIRVDAGTYTNDGGYLSDGLNNITIEGVGGTARIVDPSYYAGGKAAIVTGGQNIVLRNLDISGVTVPDGNGAGVRYDQGTLLLDNVHLHGNQNGILSAADASGSITIQNSEIDGNGTSAGNTHNIYIGDIASFTLTNSYVHDANVGHEVKSRAENNVITNNDIFDNGGTSSYSIDLPNGGNAIITGNKIEQGANSPNHVINAYGEEGGLHAGHSVNFSNNVIINDNPGGAGPLWNSSGADFTGSSGNTAWNLTDYGSAMPAGSVTAVSARPDTTPDRPAAIPVQPPASSTVPPSTPTSGGGAAPTSPSGSTPPVSAPPKSSTPPAAADDHAVFRFFDTIHGTQLLTASQAERDSILSTRPDLTYEGPGLHSVDANPADPNVATVFRFFSTADGTHLLTTSTAERDSILHTRPDLVQESSNMFEHVNRQAGDVAVYRFFNLVNGTHFFTSDQAEYANTLATRPDLKAEGIAFYAPAS